MTNKFCINIYITESDTHKLLMGRHLTYEKNSPQKMCERDTAKYLV